MNWVRVAALVVLASVCGAAQAQQGFAPGVVFDMGGKFDKSFNEAAYVGAERFKSETGIAYREFEITNEGQREQAFANMARRGVSVIIAVGFTQRSAVETVAKQFPSTKFTIIDAVVDLPNVQSIVYREQEGCYLVGMLAAMASKSGKVGFVGGMDIPLIRRFALGYEEGVHRIDPKIEVIQNMTGTTPAAWGDPTRGGELARSQFDRGADVVFAAAGTTGLGVLQAAKDAGKFSIGVDSNQNHLHPGSVLTSMIKRVDVAVYLAFKTARDGTWQPGLQVLGLAEDGIGYAVDDNNAKLITPEMRSKIEAARADIIAGRIKVSDYMAK
jgi:basic membrane protein A